LKFDNSTDTVFFAAITVVSVSDPKVPVSKTIVNAPKTVGSGFDTLVFVSHPNVPISKTTVNPDS
jgi:hypothetical protein